MKMATRERYRVFTCPFCGQRPEDPHNIEMHFGTTTGGMCRCGAVYVFDETGRMLGQAFVEALALLYGDDYDKAFSSVPEEEYEEEIISYDPRRKIYYNGSNIFERSSKFLFLKKTNPDQN